MTDNQEDPMVDKTAGGLDNVTRVPSWYMEEEVARGLTKKDRH